MCYIIPLLYDIINVSLQFSQCFFTKCIGYSANCIGAIRSQINTVRFVTNTLHKVTLTTS